MNILLIGGFGSIGKKRYEDLKYLGIKDIDIYDNDTAKGYKDGDYKKFHKQYDLIWIATNTRYHLYNFNSFAKYSENFVIEKPVSVSYSGIDSKVSNTMLFKKKNIYVAYSYRHHRGLQKLKELMDTKEYGTPFLVQMENGYGFKKLHPQYNFDKYEGILWDDIHIINTARWLWGEPIKILYKDLTDVDVRIGWLTDKNVRVHIRTDCLRPRRKKRIEVSSQQGNLIWNDSAHEIFFEKANPEEERRAIPYKHANHLFEEVKYVVDCVKEGKRFEVNTFDDACQDLKVIEELKK